MSCGNCNGCSCESSPKLEKTELRPHIDGLQLVKRDGGVVWLTFWDIVRLKFGLTDVWKLEEQYKEFEHYGK